MNLCKFLFTRNVILGILLVCFWLIIHTPAIFYGTNTLALHQSYIGDEQSPVNGALHILQDKSLLGLRNLKTVYYGPIFSVIALPVVVTDFAEKMLSGSISGAEAYKNYILFDWGGVVWKARLLATFAGALALLTFYCILMTVSVNPSAKKTLAFTGTSLLALNFYFYEYSSYFKHWIFFILIFLVQMYLVIRLHEDRMHANRYFFLHTLLFFVAFGISILGALTQIVLVPILISWVKSKDDFMVRRFFVYLFGVLGLMIVVMLWHPHAYIRGFGLVTGDVIGADTSAFSTESTGSGFSFFYYTRILLFNHLPLLLLGVILLREAILRNVNRDFVFWTPIVSFAAFYFIFGMLSHHESRYVLPMLVSLIASVSFLLIRLFDRMNRFTQIISATLVVCYLVYHIITIGFWTNVMLRGPLEELAISDAVSYQQAYPQARQLMIDSYPLGYVHSKEAYMDYITWRGREDSNLYQAILAAEPIHGTTPINMYYIIPTKFSFSSEVVHDYDRVVYHYRDTMPEPDFLEIQLTRYWVGAIVPNQYVTLFEQK